MQGMFVFVKSCSVMGLLLGSVAASMLSEKDIPEAFQKYQRETYPQLKKAAKGTDLENIVAENAFILSVSSRVSPELLNQMITRGIPTSQKEIPAAEIMPHTAAQTSTREPHDQPKKDTKADMPMKDKKRAEMDFLNNSFSSESELVEATSLLVNVVSNENWQELIQLTKNTKITSLTLSVYYTAELASQRLKEIADSMPQLQKLFLSGLKVTSEIAQVIGGMTNLRELKLWSSGRYPAVTGDLEPISQLPNLHTVDFVFGLQTEEISDKCVKALVKSNSLMRLGLAQAKITDETIAQLGTMKNLKELKLGGVAIRAADSEKWRDNLAKLQKIQVYINSDTEFTFGKERYKGRQILELWKPLNVEIFKFLNEWPSAK